MISQINEEYNQSALVITEGVNGQTGDILENKTKTKVGTHSRNN